MLERGGDQDGALASYQEALAVAGRRAAADPSLQADIAIARDRIASLAARTGRSPPAGPAQESGKRRSWLGKLLE